MESKEERDKEGIKWFLGKWLEVELVDGRIITGQLACTDRDPNIVLSKAVERWDRTEKPRTIGLAMVARRNISKILLLPGIPDYMPRQQTLPSESPASDD